LSTHVAPSRLLSQGNGFWPGEYPVDLRFRDDPNTSFYVTGPEAYYFGKPFEGFTLKGLEYRSVWRLLLFDEQRDMYMRPTRPTYHPIGLMTRQALPVDVTAPTSTYLLNDTALFYVSAFRVRQSVKYWTAYFEPQGGATQVAVYAQTYQDPAALFRSEVIDTSTDKAVTRAVTGPGWIVLVADVANCWTQVEGLVEIG